MPLCQVNIEGTGLADPADTRARLARALAEAHPQAPVIVLVHGYKFSPTIAAHDPHTHILSLDPRPSWKAVSWPRRLGLSEAGGAEPVCIGVGWEARGTLWQAYGRAKEAGAGLAALIRLVAALRPGCQVQALAHSLGARVVLSALPHLPRGAMGRAVLLAAAEMRGRVGDALTTEAGHALDLVNVTSRENELFDTLLEWLVAPHARGDRALGRGMGPLAGPGRLDLRIDDDGHRAALAALGFRIPRADRRFCHWSVYLRSGLFDVYRAVLTGALPAERLAPLLPVAQAPARSRLGQRIARPLPFGAGEAS
ncbi:alpha/beta hydrolase [Rhodovulum sp. 12E13]|uniref:alpha/beta hydrolase n=1 Tax=Rhodovulum sp. 12E13 TaxID=2203891 RepID=UPI0013144EFC|nr:alpha/beta hydrolase [Rhodovulum sp. 12E13]